MEYYRIGELAQIKEQTRTNRSVDDFFQFRSSLHITANPPPQVQRIPHLIEKKSQSKPTREKRCLVTVLNLVASS